MLAFDQGVVSSREARRMSTTGFIKLQRSPETAELLRDARAFQLLTVIATRARFVREPSLSGLTFGQAMIGDCHEFRMTEKEYRTAKARLAKWNLASFQGTPRGTVATLLDSRVFSLADERKQSKQGNQKGEPLSEENAQKGATPRAGGGRTEGEQGATNTEGKKGENGENDLCSPAGEQSMPFSLEDLEWEYPDADLAMLVAAYHETENALSRGKRITDLKAFCIGLARKMEADRVIVPLPVRAAS